jgi:hypothetical protein
MKTEEEVYAERDKLQAIDPKNAEIESIIYALDWVLERVDELEVE